VASREKRDGWEESETRGGNDAGFASISEEEEMNEAKEEEEEEKKRRMAMGDDDDENEERDRRRSGLRSVCDRRQG